MKTSNTRVLVVDDSAVCREMICDFINEAPGIEVAGSAQDGRDALAQIETLRPDVVTLDIQMPRMNGLETLDAILSRNPLPVIMVSALTQRAADITLDALERGALDYVAKPDGAASVKDSLRDELCGKFAPWRVATCDDCCAFGKNGKRRERHSRRIGTRPSIGFRSPRRRSLTNVL